MTLLKKVTLTMFIMFASTLSLLFVANAQTSYVSADSESCVVSSKSDFYNALSTQKNCIKIDNIDFGGETIQLNYNVTISANCERATIQNAYFVIKGSITDDFAPTITFENITFDGTVNAENYNLTQSASYETIFAGEREDTRCINGDYGYYNLKIDNCTSWTRAARGIFLQAIQA